MQFSIEFEPQEIEIVHTLVNNKLISNRRFITSRLDRNVNGGIPVIDDNTLWMAHVMCLLTTQQRSGPGSAINTFLAQDPFPLSLAACRQHTNLAENALQLLTDAKGIRRTNKIAKALHANLTLLESGKWDEVRHWYDRLLAQRALIPIPAHRQLEEDAADFIAGLKEIGPKQARNFWQSLGLTRYVFVLDSRILRWLNGHIAFKDGLLTPQGLGDNRYYRFISDLLFDLCKQADVLPCLFDAAVFDSFDEDIEWENPVIW